MKREHIEYIDQILSDSQNIKLNSVSIVLVFVLKLKLNSVLMFQILQYDAK